MTSIGVVIPSRDRAGLLRRAVASVSGADHVVVVDDGSVTYTSDLVEELHAVGVEYLRLPSSRGPCVARNAGIEALHTDLAFFLDDDDYVLDGGLERIGTVADENPGEMLYLHNCRFSDGGTSLEPGLTTLKLSFEEWVRLLATSSRTEFKPAVRTAVFTRDRFDDTGAAGEGLLWARVIRRYGAVLSHDPVVLYDNDPGRSRLTSQTDLLARAPANARIARAWLEEIGPATRAVDVRAWEHLLLAAAVYSNLAGDRFDPSIGLAGASIRIRLMLGVARHAPGPLLRTAFRLRRALSS
jgi:glycosyltransferase involved in cell wall biosynthesis